MEKIDITLTSKHGNRKFQADARFITDGQPKPVIIFNHGFKGFKDWGPFNIVADKFAVAGFVFIKMNFSHNGVTLDNPNEFVDLEAFAKNNFCIELDDTGVLIDYLFSDASAIPGHEMDLDELYLMGHSRGGASAILKANGDNRIKKLVTWAAVNNLEAWHSKEELDYWRKNGRIYIHNGRTNQEMPLDFQLVENFIKNNDRLHVPDAVKNMSIPMLSIHGSDDPTVPVSVVKEIKEWNPQAEIKIINGAQHTFGGGHPFEGMELPADLKRVVEITLSFFRKIS
ncbi:MAG: alpha/beta hydrolase [Cyclobacteriaceae bacterium]|nr:alpha/beta hydrolase [Cyclobacteriaceae bacterium]